MSLPDSATVQTPPTPIFIGLDLSLASTGVAIIHGEVVTVTRIRTKGTTGETTADTATRLRTIVNRIMERVPISDHTHVAVEGPSYGSVGPGQHVRGGLWWLVRAELAFEGIDTMVVAPATVKKYATGRGNAGKDEVLAAVIRRYAHVEVSGNDEADALVLAAIRARYNGCPVEESLPQVNIDALKGLAR